MDKFWTCWVEDTTPGTRKHFSPEEAHDEARRLGRIRHNIGKKVYVMECIEYCEVPELPVAWHIFAKEG